MEEQTEISKELTRDVNCQQRNKKKSVKSYWTVGTFLFFKEPYAPFKKLSIYIYTCGEVIFPDNKASFPRPTWKSGSWQQTP